MTDRELLEAAAKAAGVDVRWYQSDCLRVSDKCNGFSGKWNPLTDDGDALRLAVKLHFTVVSNESASWIAHGAGQMNIAEVSHDGTDPYAATRRAIVRAAAEIGRTK